MNFNTIRDLASLDMASFRAMMINPITFYEAFANRMSFYEWVQLYFHNKNFANNLNGLVGERYHLGHTFVDLLDQPLSGENEYSLLEKIAVKFSQMMHFRIDLDHFKTDQTCIFSTISHLKNLRKIEIHASCLKIKFFHGIFPKLTKMTLFIKQYNDFSVDSESLDSMIIQMPNLRSLTLKNFRLSNSTFLHIFRLHLEEIIFYNMICDLETIKFLIFKDSLRSLLILRDNAFSLINPYNFLDIVLSIFQFGDSNIKKFVFDVPDSNQPMLFENILHLKKLKLLVIFVNVSNQYVYNNLYQIFSIVPYISSTCQIKINLIDPLNDFVQGFLYEAKTICEFIYECASELQDRCPNFSFDEIHILTNQ